MSVEQRIKVSCDDFDCSASIVSGVGLTAARTMTSQAGWVNTVHTIGSEGRVVLQDFCPEHRDRGFDWNTWWKQERERIGSELTEGEALTLNPAAITCTTNGVRDA